MGTEQEIFDSDNEDETEVGTAQAPPLAEDEASAQEQAAQKPPQGKAPDPAAQGAAPQQESDKPNYTVPLPEHLSVRERAQRAEQERDQLRQALEQFQRREQEAQRAAQAKPPEAPDQFADPQGYTNFMLQQQQQIAHALRQEARMERLNESLEDAAEQYGEAWQAAFNALVATQDRTLVDKLTANPRRAGKAIMDWHRQQEVLRTVGPDPAAYRQKLQDELLNDQAFVAKVIEHVRAAQGQPQQSRPQNVTRLPPSLNRVTSAAPAHGDDDGDDSEEAIFAAGRSRRSR